MNLKSTLLTTALAVSMLPSAFAAPKKLLVVTITTGFRHGPAIDAAEKVLPELAAKSGGEFAFDFISQPGPRPNGDKAKSEGPAWDAKVKELFGKLAPAALTSANYDGVIFCNTTGDLPLPDGEGFANWVKSGKAFIGMHAATDTLKSMAPYYEMINGSFAGHLWHAGGTYTFTNHETSHPTVAMFPASFEWKDEIYQYSHYNPESVRVLLSLDLAKSKPQAPYHVPVSWVRDVGAGRLFYTNLGHNPETWTNDTYQKHIVAGIRWALKIIDGPAQPNPSVSAEQSIKSFAATTATILSIKGDELEKKGLAKAKADPAWALKFWALADTYHALPTPDAKKGAKPEELAKASTAKSELIKRLISEIEK
jgi:hypothetical protein